MARRNNPFADSGLSRPYQHLAQELLAQNRRMRRRYPKRDIPLMSDEQAADYADRIRETNVARAFRLRSRSKLDEEFYDIYDELIDVFGVDMHAEEFYPKRAS